MDGITNLGAPRGTGPDGRRRRGLGAGRRGMLSVYDGDINLEKRSLISILSSPLPVIERRTQTVETGGSCSWVRSPGPKGRNLLFFERVTTAGERGGTRRGKGRTSEAGEQNGPEHKGSRSPVARAVLMATLSASQQFILTMAGERTVAGTYITRVALESKTTRYIHQRVVAR